MFGFFFKKNLCDVWDNLFYVVIVNFFSLVAIFLSALMIRFSLFTQLPEWARYPVVFSLFLVSCILVCTIAFAGGENAKSICSFNTPRYGKFFRNIISSFKDGIFMGIFIGVVVAIAVVSMPFYFRMWRPSDGSRGSFLWLIFMLVIFWFLFTTFFALQWFLPVRTMMRNGYGKCLKKCYILFIDNMGFTFGMFFVNFLNTVLTVITFGLFPGMTGIIITNMNALRLRLYKYDWIEVNPGLTPEERKNVPWEDLLAKDRKTLGPRSFKTFVFPWKE